MHSPALGFMAGMRLFTETVTPWTKESLWGNEQLGDQLEDMIKNYISGCFGQQAVIAYVTSQWADISSSYDTS